MSFYIGDTKIIGVYVGSTEIKSSYVGDIKVYGEDEPIVNYLKFTAKANNSTIGLQTISTGQTMEYTTDGTNWLSMTTATTIQLSSGDSAYVRGELISNNTSSNYTKFTMSGDIKASGNINYLWNNDPTEPLKEYCGRGLFSGCAALSDVSELDLPSIEISKGGYYEMFKGCTSLVTAPTLPATTVGQQAYNYMFEGCTSLTTPPALPATTISNSYRGMFRGCTSLATAPELPATTLTGLSYREMFAGCTSLTAAPALPATEWSGVWTYYGMFSGCTSLTTAPALPATTFGQNAYAYMFAGCTSLTAAPELPATTLDVSCYSGMFAGCTALVNAPTELPATTLVTSCYNNMFGGCTSLTTAPRLLFDVWDSGSVTGMFSGCSNLNYIECLASSQIGGSASNWVDGVAATGTFIKKSGTTWAIGNEGIPSGWTVQDYVEEFITFTAKADNSTVGLNKQSTNQTLEYSLDKNTWSAMTTADTFQLASGDSVFIRGILSANNAKNNYTNFALGGNVEVKGDISYMLNYQDPTTYLRNFCGYALFSGCTSLTDVSGLKLSEKRLANSCYARMFEGCTSLTTAPALPSMTLENLCYQYIFKGCSSLTTPPALPAMTLKINCYSYMFDNCTSLTTAPELPATTLNDYCYQYMFNGCSSLTTPPALPATALGDSCYKYMFNGCSSLTTAPVLPAATLKSFCYNNMFANCTSLTTAPVLPAATLKSFCYNNMFSGCKNLNYIKCLATDISAEYCTYNWVNGVAATGTFIKDPNMSSWTTGEYDGIPTGWTVQDAT